MKREATPFTGLALSGFCMQVSILLQSAIPLYEGLQVMAEDAPGEREREILTAMSDKTRMGFPFSQTIAEAGCFPDYVINMTLLGERTGTLDVTLESLSDYYEREYHLAENLRKAVTYPAMMILMLIVILFVLFTKVMPVFSGVYEQLGTSLPPVAEAAIRFGSILSGVALTAAAVLATVMVIMWMMGKSGRNSALATSVLEKIKSHSKIARTAADRRLCSVLAMTFRCGMDISEGFKLAETLVDNKAVVQGIHKCQEQLAVGQSFYESVKVSGLFTGFDLQMVRVGSRAGQLEGIMKKLADDFDKKSVESIDGLIARLEPTIVSVLAVAVGLVLLSVMLPLVGVLSTIG